MIKHINQLKKRKLRNLVKFNVLYGGFSLTTENIFNRLVDQKTRRKLKSTALRLKGRMIIVKIGRLLQINKKNT